MLFVMDLIDHIKAQPITLVMTGGLLALGLLYYLILEPLYLSPLAKVPGPKIAALTSWYLNRRYLTEDGVVLIEQLHRKYGPIVRVGPNEVDIDDPKDLQTIYGIRSNFRKPDSSVLFQNHDHPCVFSSITREEHKERRRRTAKIYTMTSVLNNQRFMSSVENLAQTTYDQIEKRQGQVLDIFDVGGRFALDVSSSIVYGSSLNMLEGENDLAAEHIRLIGVVALPLFRFFNLAKVLLLPPFTFLLPSTYKDALSRRDPLEEMNWKYVNQVLKSDKRPDPADSTLACLVSQPEYGNTLNDSHIASECFDNMAAGGDSSAATISYMFWTLALPENAAVQEKLHKEVSSLSLPLSHKDIGALRYLSAVLMEVMRVYPGGPGSVLQRIAPKGQTTPFTFGKRTYLIPPETSVCVQAYSVHRRPDIWGDDTEIFRPERWLDVDAATLQRMKDAWIPFGAGARTCLGVNVAMVELKYLTCLLLRDFRIELPVNTDRNDMNVMWGGVIRPKAERCNLIFVRRE